MGERGNAQIPPHVGDLGGWRRQIQSAAEIAQAVAADYRTVAELAPDMLAEVTLLRLAGDMPQDKRSTTEQPDPAHTNEIDPDLAGHIQRMRPIIDKLPLERLQAFQRNQEMLTLVRTVLGQRYAALANQLRPIPPAPYVTRAIGQPSPEPMTNRWHEIRGKIEVGRQLLGVADPSVTLGPAPTEQWEQGYYTEIVSNVQRIQLGQIMLSGAGTAVDSRAVAAEFGKSVIIDELGPPPSYDPLDVSSIVETGRSDEWHDAALAMLPQIEPVANGLLIDRA